MALVDIINEKDLFEKALSPAIQQITAQLVPALKAAVAEVLAEAIGTLNGRTIPAVQKALDAVLTQAFERLAIERAAILAGVDAAIARVDGAKLTLGPGK